MKLKRTTGPGVPRPTKRTLSVQMRLLIYVSATVFMLAGLEMILLAFSSNNTAPVMAVGNGLQPGSQSAALATALPQSLASAGDNLPNSKEEAAAFAKSHQSQFDFGKNAAALKAAGYNLKSGLNLVPAGSGTSHQPVVAALQAGIADQQQRLEKSPLNLAAHDIAATPDIYEPDNTPQRATQINVTLAPDLSGSQAHTFTDVNDVDWAYFVVRKTSVSYTIFTNATKASGVDTRLDLYDAKLNLIASNDDARVLVGDNPGNSTIVFTPPDTAGPTTYYVRVSDVAVDGSAGAYFLTAYQQSSTATVTPTAIPTFTAAPTNASATPLACSDSYELDNRPSQAKLLSPSLSTLAAFGTTGLPSVDSSNDGTQSHLICPTGDLDWVYMDLVAGKPYSIFTSSLKGGLDTFVLLYSVDSSGNVTPLYSNDDFPNAALASRIDWVVPSSPTTPLGSFVRYYLAVKDVAGHGGPGLSYNLTLATVGNPAGDCNDFYQPDYSPTQAKDIQINEAQTRVFCPAGNSHWVRLYAKASRTYVLQTFFGVGTPGLDTSVTIYSVAFDSATPAKVVATTPLTSQRTNPNSSTGDLSSTVIFTVSSEGYYYAQIRNVANNGQPGLNYRLFFGVTSGNGGDIGTTQTAGVVQTAGTQTAGVAQTAGTQIAGQTATNNASNNNNTATAFAATIFAVNGTLTAIGGTATALGTPNPTQQTVNARASLTATAQGTPASTPTITGTTGAQAQPPKLNAAYFADLNFSSLWNQVDKAVAEGKANRSWEYGPKPGPQKLESYVEASGGTRQVQYFAKSRMEINNPKSNRDSSWFVTNGLLVKEMVSGGIAMGDNKFQLLPAPSIPVAGDLSADNTAPTYASFGKLITINNSNRAADQTSQSVSQSLNRDGTLTGLANPIEQIQLTNYVPETGHNLAAPFWSYLNSEGLIYKDGQFTNAPLMDWVFVMGLPISEPYWVKAKVGGIERDVLVQVFERRVLTYTPSNGDGWKVEMGNVGEHYYLWRYGISLYAPDEGN